jgi:hypothetical protein
MVSAAHPRHSVDRCGEKAARIRSTSARRYSAGRGRSASFARLEAVASEAIPGDQLAALGPGVHGLNVADNTLLVTDGEALTVERGAELVERALVRVLREKVSAEEQLSTIPVLRVQLLRPRAQVREFSLRITAPEHAQSESVRRRRPSAALDEAFGPSFCLLPALGRPRERLNPSQAVFVPLHPDSPVFGVVQHAHAATLPSEGRQGPPLSHTALPSPAARRPASRAANTLAR